MRGAIAVALVYYYFDPRGMSEDIHRSTIIATTLILVLFSTVIFSAATKPLLEFMLGPQGSISHLSWQLLTSLTEDFTASPDHAAALADFDKAAELIRTRAATETSSETGLSAPPLHDGVAAKAFDWS